RTQMVRTLVAASICRQGHRKRTLVCKTGDTDPYFQPTTPGRKVTYVSCSRFLAPAAPTISRGDRCGIVRLDACCSVARPNARRAARPLAEHLQTWRIDAAGHRRWAVCIIASDST